MKRLIGRTDMEDALKKLDKLTHEEARMAVAQNLKATHNVDERVIGVANTMVAVDNRVAGVDDRVAKVDDRVASVGDQVAKVDDRIAGVDDQIAKVEDSVAGVDDRVAGVNMVVEQTANDVDQIKRSSSLNLISAGCWTLHVPFRGTIARERSQMALPSGPIKEP
jgi:archaellum component FlaC